MTPEQVAAEAQLWAEMMNYRPLIDSTKKNARAIAEIKRKHPRDWKLLVQRLGYINEEKATARSWQLYKRWAENGQQESPHPAQVLDVQRERQTPVLRRSRQQGT